MKRPCASLLLAVTALAFSVSTVESTTIGRWNVGGKVGIVQVGTTYGVKTAVTAEYRIMSILTWRTDLEMLMHQLDDMTQTDISVPSNLLYYPFASRGIIDPYAGPGLTYTHTYTGTNGLGANVLAGVNFRPYRGKTFGVEAKYTLPLLPTPTRGSVEVGLTGAWEVQF